MNLFIKKSSSEEEDISYALLGFLVKTAESAGVFANSSGEQVKISDHIYVVGGAVRNFVIGAPVKDIDIVIDAIALSTRRVKRDAAWFADLIISKAPSHAGISKTSNSFGVEILHVSGDWEVNGRSLKGQDIEIANARKESYTDGGYKPTEVVEATIEEDARRREFTFNTLLWSFADLSENGPSEDIIIDPLGTGLSDLKNNIIETPLDPSDTFKDDASRMMRAMKFKFKYGFELSDRVEDAIKTNPEFLRMVPKEVLYVLLTTTILNQENYKKALDAMSSNGLLDELRRLMNEDKQFRASIKNWVLDKKDFNYLLSLVDYNLPLTGPIDFLSDNDLGKFRSNISYMSKEEQEEYHQSLKNIGSAIKDKSFFIKSFNLTMGEGAKKSDIPVFRIKYYEPIARSIILESPGLLRDPEGLKAAITEELIDSVGPQSGSSETIESKLAVLACYLNKKGRYAEAREVSSYLRKEAGSIDDVFIPDFYGHLYIFDMDDTLFWAPDWHSSVGFDEKGVVESVDDSLGLVLSEAFNFVNEVNLNPNKFIRKGQAGKGNKALADEERQLLAEEFSNNVSPIKLEKDIIDMQFIGKTNQTILILKDKEGKAVTPNLFKKFFSGKIAKLFDLREKYVPNAVVIAGDPTFYQNPETLGRSPNSKIFDIYREKSENAIILTARESFPGMQEGIFSRIQQEGAEPPLEVYTKPQGLKSGDYKGEIIGRIASQGTVSEITFYDDNLSYVDSVKSVLKERYKPYADKVNIEIVSTESKP